MAVVCEGQLLLLTQPTDGPVTEPSVLGSVPITEVLIDDNVCFFFTLLHRRSHTAITIIILSYIWNYMHLP